MKESKLIFHFFDITEELEAERFGLVVDIFHLWWDPNLEKEIRRCGNNGQLFAFHICYWKTLAEDLLLDRGLMGEGCINIRQIRGWVESAGFSGFNEVEIFSNKYWAMDQNAFVQMIVDAYLKYS